MRHFATRSTVALAATVLSMLVGAASPALACAGLIGSNGAVNLGRTTTLAAYHDGVEHYVTAFKFLGGGGQLGTLIPLPDVPNASCARHSRRVPLHSQRHKPPRLETESRSCCRHAWTRSI